MFKVHSIRSMTLAIVSLILILWADSGAVLALGESASEALEVRVLEAQVPPDQGARDGVRYRMEILSVLRSGSRLKPGDRIVVLAYTDSKAIQAKNQVVDSKAPVLLAPGWIGIAYLSPDPKATGPEARWQFVIAANGGSFEDLPPAPPSLRWKQ